MAEEPPSTENLAEPASEACRDRALALAAAKGDEAAFEEIVRTFAPRLQALLYRMLLDWGDARDAAQEAFVRAWRALPRWRPRGSFRAWLFQIGARVALDALRARPRRPEHPRRAGAESEEALVSLGREDRHVEQREILEAIEASVASLPADLRTAFVLAEYEGAGHAEIAETLGCTRKGAEMRLYRARQALREKLAPFLKS
ncbi:MAG: sigma-70 family RNA polymerase sigma factor [Verrucomicrobiae bacterium]|nr:sigma-70 family RNA polymerase sigma factor [Verrucomicrobiae bacterium]